MLCWFFTLCVITAIFPWGADWFCTNQNNAFDGNPKTFAALRPGRALVLELDEAVSINSIVLREHGVAYGQPGNSRLFRIEAYQNGSWEIIYGSDVIGAVRICVVDEMEVSAVRLVIDETAKRTVRISEMSIALQEPAGREKPFRVVGYFHPNVFIYDDISNYADQFEVATHVIYIGNTTLGLCDEGRPTVLFSEQSPQNISALQQAVGGRSDVLISLTCGARVNGLNVLTDNPQDIERIAGQLFDFVQEKSLDGVEINFEGSWRDSRVHRAAYSMLIETLAPMLHEVNKSITVSVVSNFPFTARALELLDYINIMSYDHMDTEQVWHSTYNAMQRDIRDLAVRGVPLIDSTGKVMGTHQPFPREKLNGGVPFYGMGNLGGVREWDRTFSFGRLYREANGDFNPHANYCLATSSYYNGPTTIRDKAAYMLLQAELGGIMIWALNHDTEFSNPYSLLRTIGDTMDRFSCGR